MKAKIYNPSSAEFVGSYGNSTPLTIPPHGLAVVPLDVAHDIQKRYPALEVTEATPAEATEIEKKATALEKENKTAEEARTKYQAKQAAADAKKAAATKKRVAAEAEEVAKEADTRVKSLIKTEKVGSSAKPPKSKAGKSKPKKGTKK
jgi:hypothetical protein